jgi:hypothetical protein
MKPAPIITVVCATLVAIGTAYWLDAGEMKKKPYPKATPPPPPSSVYTPSKERAPTAEEIARDAREHNAQLALAIERSLVASNPQQRETAFTFLVPELLQVEPQRLVAMVAAQEPGETRDVLRNEVARQWITRDRDVAIKWLKSLDSEAERRESAQVAVKTLAAVAPDQAVYVADQFGVGRDDGSLEHIVQIWAEHNLDAAIRWIETQPAGPATDQLRTRIEQVRKHRQSRG